MAHLNQLLFCMKMKAIFPAYFRWVKVLDIGSMDVNGTNKYLFDFCVYRGMDLEKGDNVDLVGRGHELDWRDCSVDTIICTEVFEHDKYWPETIKNCIRMLDMGGLFIFTCASTGRPEHGTIRTSPESSPSTNDYYMNLTEKDIRSVTGFSDSWAYHRFELRGTDLYFFGVKKFPRQLFYLHVRHRFKPSVLRFIRVYYQYWYARRIRDAKKMIKKWTRKLENRFRFSSEYLSRFF